VLQYEKGFYFLLVSRPYCNMNKEVLFF